ncbi:MAG: hypothetical protein WEC75_11190 [Dehalococcoidia bacterium]
METHLTNYAESANPETQRHFKDIPAYLRDVLLWCSYSYVPSPANYLWLVRRLLEPMTHEVLFIVLNYDTLLEDALSLYSPGFAIASMDDYVAMDPVKVVKVHGSTSWVVPIAGTARSPNWRDAVAAFDPLDPAHDRRVMLDTRREQSYLIRNIGTGDFMYPWLTAPTRGKTFRCPDTHREVARRFLRDCRKFLVVGTSGLDDDLLTELRDVTAGSEFPYLIHYVDPSSAVEDRFSSAIPAFCHRSPATPRSNRLRVGLNRYLAMPDLENLLAAR